MDVRFPLNNPIKPCSVLDKICWYTATSNIKITEIIPFTKKTNVKNRTFLVSMDVMSLDTNIHQNEGILKLSVTKHEYDIRAKTPTRMTTAITFSRQNTFRSNDATATRTSLRKWICVPSVLIAITGYPFTLSNVGEPSWSWISRDHSQAQKEK